MIKVLFGRKVKDLQELKEFTETAIRQGQEGQPYTVTRTVILRDDDFKSFAEDFLKDQPWIRPEDGGISEDREIRCIKVVNKDTGEKVLINPEGYNYPRYTGLELD